MAVGVLTEVVIDRPSAVGGSVMALAMRRANQKDLANLKWIMES